ncbi:MAG: hypothetical protein ACKVU4_15760 [Phycisphaerales bacterium]
MHRLFVVSAALGLSAGAAHADVLAGWTFETSIPATAGPHAAELGVFSGAASPASGFHADPGVVYSNPAGNGSPESFSSNFWTIGDSYRFSSSTLGYNTITFAFDQTRSSTGPATFDVEWSLDGVNFSTLLNDYTVLNNAAPPGAWNATTAFPEYHFGPLALPAGAADQALIVFRLGNQVAPGGTGGTNRVDNVMVEGTLIPTPGVAAVLAIAGLAGLRRRR